MVVYSVVSMVDWMAVWSVGHWAAETAGVMVVKMVADLVESMAGSLDFYSVVTTAVLTADLKAGSTAGATADERVGQSVVYLVDQKAVW